MTFAAAPCRRVAAQSVSRGTPEYQGNAPLRSTIPVVIYLKFQRLLDAAKGLPVLAFFLGLK
jgi:hypothetical protein